MSEEFTIQNVEMLMTQKNFRGLLESCKAHNKFLKEFPKMKWLNQIYHLGDHMIIERTSLINKKIKHVVKLNGVYCVHGFDDDQQFPLVEVQFYASKEDLPQPIRERYADCFSEQEVFLTPETDVLFVEVVQKKCQVVPYEEYESMQPTQTLYYTRATYNKPTQQVEPPVEQWTKSCLCSKPVNPDRPYIFCDGCQEWFHMDCMKITQEEADQHDEYHCIRCSKIQVE